MEKAFESIIQSISAFYGTTNAKTIDQSILQRFIWLVITVNLCCVLFSNVQTLILRAEKKLSDLFQTFTFLI